MSQNGLQHCWNKADIKISQKIISIQRNTLLRSFFSIWTALHPNKVRKLSFFCSSSQFNWNLQKYQVRPGYKYWYWTLNIVLCTYYSCQFKSEKNYEVKAGLLIHVQLGFVHPWLGWMIHQETWISTYNCCQWLIFKDSLLGVPTFSRKLPDLAWWLIFWTIFC